MLRILQPDDRDEKRNQRPGRQKADPTAAILSAAMLCEHLGFTGEAAKIEQAAADDLVERQGAWAARSTAEIGDDIAERVAG